MVTIQIHTVLLHDGEELDNDLGAGADKHLTLSFLFSIADALQTVILDAWKGKIGKVNISHL